MLRAKKRQEVAVQHKKLRGADYFPADSCANHCWFLQKKIRSLRVSLGAVGRARVLLRFGYATTTRALATADAALPRIALVAPPLLLRTELWYYRAALGWNLPKKD